MWAVAFAWRKQMNLTRGTVFLALLCVLACRGVQSQAAGQDMPKTPAGAPKALAAAKAGFDPALLQPAALKAPAHAEFEGKFVTTAGEFTIRVARSWSPNGADRFYNLVTHHFYDGAAFFRVLPGFMAQFGMSAYPEVSRAWQQANIKDDRVLQSNRRGYVSFAMAGTNTPTTH